MPHEVSTVPRLKTDKQFIHSILSYSLYFYNASLSPNSFNDNIFKNCCSLLEYTTQHIANLR
jgi:hypothetical protein